MIELDDVRTQAEIFGEREMRRDGNDIRPSAINPIGGGIWELTCYVCKRRWCGEEWELKSFYSSKHKHPAREHIDWYRYMYKGWPVGFLELINALLWTLDELGVEGREKFQELADKIDAMESYP